MKNMRRTLLVSLLWPAIAMCQTSPPAPAPVCHGSHSAMPGHPATRRSRIKIPDTRKQAAIALSLVGSAEPFPSQLESLLDDKDVEVRLAAVASLADLKNNRTNAGAPQSLERRSAGGQLRRRAIPVGAGRSGGQEGSALYRERRKQGIVRDTLRNRSAMRCE